MSLVRPTSIDKFLHTEEDADGLEKVTVSFEEPEEAAVDWIGVCFYRIKRAIISTGEFAIVLEDNSRDT